MGSLGPRERDILLLLALGYSRKEISRRLRLSPHTIRFYIRLSCRRLGVPNAMSAVVAAIAAGEIAPHLYETRT